MIKKSVSKKIMIMSLIFILLIVLFGFGKYFYDKGTDISSVNTNTTGQLVKRTSEPNGYSSQQSTTKSSKEISQPVAPVENTGNASWLQIVSQGTGEKFTNLSSGDFKIYKAHSPQILKTATSADSPVLSMSEVMD